MISFGGEISAAIINFRTPDLTTAAVRSFRKFYPDVPLTLVDNGSFDDSASVLGNVRDEAPTVTQLILNPSNRFHGPAMDQVVRHVSSEFVLFLDSDCEIQTGGFIEQMLSHMRAEKRCYAVGKRVFMNRRGFHVKDGAGSIAYIHPICMLLRRSSYLMLTPFRHHGSPCLDNMREAAKQDYLLVDFPIFDFITHTGRGTARRHGYGLGMRGKLNYLLNKMGL